VLWKCNKNQVTEGKIEGVRRRRRRLKQLLDDLKENRRYWHLREEVLDRNFWTTRWKCPYTHPLVQICYYACVMYGGRWE